MLICSEPVCICWPFYFSLQTKMTDDPNLSVTSSSNHLFGCNTDRRGGTDVPPGLVRLPRGEEGGAGGLQIIFVSPSGLSLV